MLTALRLAPYRLYFYSYNCGKRMEQKGIKAAFLYWNHTDSHRRPASAYTSFRCRIAQTVTFFSSIS